MGLQPDSMLIVQAQVFQQIDAIETASRLGQRAPLSDRVEALGAMAQDLDLPAVAAIAQQMRKAVAQTSGLITLRPFLDALQDAVHCHPADAATTSTLLAAINQRFAA